MNSDDIYLQNKSFEADVKNFGMFCTELGLSRYETSLGYVVSQTLVDRIVLGVDNKCQIAKLLGRINDLPCINRGLQPINQNVINPRNW